jgi:hypothetical protein
MKTLRDSSAVERRAHYPCVAGSTPAPATILPGLADLDPETAYLHTLDYALLCTEMDEVYEAIVRSRPVHIHYTVWR